MVEKGSVNLPFALLHQFNGVIDLWVMDSSIFTFLSRRRGRVGLLDESRLYNVMTLPRSRRSL
ncbi:hypothetical protein NQZ68_017568 [Dissostichus eleginoides]|nr:hypothetical protein NQZ68_017568 [Dissostichus eleginoides]